MLVKHNISNVDEFKFIESSWTSSGYYEKAIDKNIFKFRNNTNSINTAGFGFSFNAKEKAEYFYMDLENIGDNPINFDFENIENQNFQILLKSREKVKICRKINSRINLRLYTIVNPNEWHGFKLRCFALTKDESNVYLPNINTLPTDKQALLPPEGDYKEIIPNN